MRVHVSRRVSRRPLAIAIGVSVGLHLLLLAVVLLVRPPANPYMVKRGEPLFIELPKAEGPAERGAPPAASPTPKGPRRRLRRRKWRLFRPVRRWSIADPHYAEADRQGPVVRERDGPGSKANRSRSTRPIRSTTTTWSACGG